MENSICQSCGMPMNSKEVFGTNSDGTPNTDYCTYCYQKGNFTSVNITMEEEIEICVPFMKEDGMDEDEARELLKKTFPKLKRWEK
ncbi:MAG: zinc ribbon domain-containing protein [Clostridium sp.]|uniref:zinc ribbon domain-containing protein n=1 Tax=Clostridium sp. TaxID=1506 RepID=UPI003D6C84A4